MAQLDAHLFSYTDYGASQGALWQPSHAQQEGWARTHARAIAGIPLNMSFDPVSKAFDFCYAPDAAIAAAPTEIFASLAFSYACGREVHATANLVVSALADSDVVRVSLAPGSEGRAAIGCVHIRRACAERAVDTPTW